MTKPPSPRPLSIKVIAIIYGLTALFQLSDVGSDVAVVGIFLSGGSAVLMNILYSVLQLWLRFGVWKLWDIARRIAIGWQLYGLVFQVWWLSSEHMQKLVADMRDIWRPAGIEPSVVQAIYTATFSVGIVIVFGLIVIWFLIKRKSAFVKAASSV